MDAGQFYSKISVDVERNEDIVEKAKEVCYLESYSEIYNAHISYLARRAIPRTPS